MFIAVNTAYYIGPHHITGNGVGFKPDILDMDVMEEVLMVSMLNVASKPIVCATENKEKRR